MIMKQMNDIEFFFNNFNLLESKLNKVNPTYMEISGYPHFENVMSNILAFFFDTEDHHGFKDLFVKSLFICSGMQSVPEEISVYKMQREAVTNSNKRIDIVFETDQHIIAIENKVWADLYNDLGDYAKFIKVQNVEQKQELKIVLSARNVDNNLLSNGFINVNYITFGNELLNQFGKYSIQANAKYVIIATDFIETMLNFTKPISMNTEILNFFINNKSTLDRILLERGNIYNAIFQKIKVIQSKINPLGASQWIHQKVTLVHDFRLENKHTISVDCNFDLEGIQITVFVRSDMQNKNDYIKRLQIYSENLKLDSRLIVYERSQLPLSTEIHEIEAKLQEVLNGISLRP